MTSDLGRAGHWHVGMMCLCRRCRRPARPTPSMRRRSLGCPRARRDRARVDRGAARGAPRPASPPSARARWTARRRSPRNSASSGPTALRGARRRHAVDAIYVASPHSEHHEHALLALDAGKPVLVEKAFTRNAAEAAEVVDAARERGRARGRGDVDAVPAAHRRRAPLPGTRAARRDLGRRGRPRPAALSRRPAAPGRPRARGRSVARPRRLPGLVRPHGARRLQRRCRRRAALAETGVDAGETIAVIGPQGAIGTLAVDDAGQDAVLGVDLGHRGPPRARRLVLPAEHGAPDRSSTTARSTASRRPRREHGLAYEAAEFARLLAAGGDRVRGRRPGRGGGRRAHGGGRCRHRRLRCDLARAD